MLIRIKNGQKVQLDAVVLHPQMPKFCYKVLEVLYEEGFIRGFTCKKRGDHVVEVKALLKYSNGGSPVITNIQNISTPGRRIYASVHSLWKIQNGSGVIILSTSKGIMTDRDARFLNLGGELLCAIT